MVGTGRRAAGMIDLKLHGLAELQGCAFEAALMKEEAAELLLRVGDGEARAARACDLALVADLAARFAIEGRLIDDDDALVAGLQLLHARAVLDERHDLARGGLARIA